LDEVATGFGRTGKMFACEYVKGIRPDFMCLSKGITAGYLPLGITVTTEIIYKAFYADYNKKKTFYHGHTYTGNPLSCQAAIASLDTFKKENTLKHVEKISVKLQKYLNGFKRYSFIGDIRCTGMIGALELVKDRHTKGNFDFNERIGYEIYKEGLRHNLILRPLGDIIYLFLPLSVKESELKDIISKIHKVFRSFSSQNLR
jgi:adenosylmethionine-8-amino-7-oxononanoate aminotransferase